MKQVNRLTLPSSISWIVISKPPPGTLPLGSWKQSLHSACHSYRRAHVVFSAATKFHRLNVSLRYCRSPGQCLELAVRKKSILVSAVLALMSVLRVPALLTTSLQMRTRSVRAISPLSLTQMTYSSRLGVTACDYDVAVNVTNNASSLLIYHPLVFAPCSCASKLPIAVLSR